MKLDEAHHNAVVDGAADKTDGDDVYFYLREKPDENHNAVGHAANTGNT